MYGAKIDLSKSVLKLADFGLAKELHERGP
jgi:hypothetical protein